MNNMKKRRDFTKDSTPKWVTCDLECEGCEENEKCLLLRTKGERK